MTSFLQFEPIYQERVWGGRYLENYLGRRLPGSAPIGESWEIVDRPEAQSVISDGPWKGKTLRQMIEEKSAEIMGPSWPKDRSFPILVKWLDCRDRLSVQVHPPAAIAAKLGGEPKTENWYFGKTDPGAAVYAGLKAGVTKESFEKAIASGTVDQCLDRLPVKDGDSLLIHSGIMHAIDAGNVILEIQQNSDTTYRVYDWGRVGLDGKPRTLHVRESLESLAANTAPAPRLLRSEKPSEVLVRSREFILRRERLKAGGKLTFATGDQARVLSVVEGTLVNEKNPGQSVGFGGNVLLPYGGGFSFVAKEDTVALITENFSK
ncbi:MAG TPA: type I phosphomannose isomerase catalytic subunit [Lacunisphaera sp.]|jgi:mannose-6-phosphate isomerase